MCHVKLETGIYKHYKGPTYEVMGCARHSETEELMVFYRALYGDFGLWVRPLSMFTESVVVDGVSRARFSLVEAYPVILGRNAAQA